MSRGEEKGGKKGGKKGGRVVSYHGPVETKRIKI